MTSAVPLIQRLSSKEWNIRLAANEELIALLNDSDESNVAEFAKFGMRAFLSFSLSFNLISNYFSPTTQEDYS